MSQALDEYCPLHRAGEIISKKSIKDQLQKMTRCKVKGRQDIKERKRVGAAQW